MTGWAAALGILALGAAAAALCQRQILRRTLCRLEEMLARGIDGSFAPQRFDESRLSALEAQFARYLSASALSARQVRRERDAVESLVGDIAHQARTPMANIRLYAQLLLEQPLDPQGRQCAQALTDQTEKLQDLLEALVKTSRLESGMLALHPETGPLAPLAARAAAQLRPAAAEKGIVLTQQTPEDLAARFDPKWTEEALCILLDNAVKYTPPGGAVTLRARGYALFCRIDVTDTGPGIPEAEQAKIFARFYRSPGAAQAPGVGIGLYLARQIARRQGGYLTVSSPGGGGSTFSLFLPRPDPPSAGPNLTKPLDF